MIHVVQKFNSKASVLPHDTNCATRKKSHCRPPYPLETSAATTPTISPTPTPTPSLAPTPTLLQTQQYKELFKTANPLALTPDQQDAKIHESFQNEDTLPHETILADAIGKKQDAPKVMNPQAQEAMKHPAAPLLKHYADHGCPDRDGFTHTSTSHIQLT